MHWLWYIPIFGLIMISVVAYRKRKAIERYGTSEFTLFECVLGNEATVVAIAAIAMGLILLAMASLSPGGERYKRQRQRRENHFLHAAAETLGAGLRKHLQEDDRVLLVVPPRGRQAENYLGLVESGLLRGFGRDVPVVLHEMPAPPVTPGDEAKVAKRENLTVETVDQLAEEHADCRVIVTFVDLPADLPQAELREALLKGERVLGACLTNAYMMGGPIQLGMVAACVMPQPVYRPDEPVSEGTPLREVFGMRYLYADQENVIETAQQNKRMFKFRLRL